MMRNTVHEKLLRGRIESPFGDSGLNGAFRIIGPAGVSLQIIATDGKDPDAQSWEHVSVSVGHRMPNWVEMCFVKDLFWGEEECVVQYHPPKSDYVTNHPNVLHMWRHRTMEFPRPPAIFVGFKQDGEYANAEEARAGWQRAKERGEI